MLKKPSLAVAAVAIISMPIAPVSAAEFNINTSAKALSYEEGQLDWTEDNADRRRRHRRYRRGRVSAGDIFAGIAILGGIAVIADAASKSKKRKRDRYDYQQPQRAPQDGFGGNDIGTAVNLCSDAALQSAGADYRVDRINSVSQDGNGWRVDGALIGPQSTGFSCGVSNGGVQFIQLN